LVCIEDGEAESGTVRPRLNPAFGVGLGNAHASCCVVQMDPPGTGDTSDVAGPSEHLAYDPACHGYGRPCFWQAENHESRTREVDWGAST
jgi:hypothetical protein